jgi:hypothetical protein
VGDDTAAAARSPNKTKEASAMEITNRMEEAARAFEDRVRPRIDEAKQQLSDLNGKVTSFIKENPGKCLLGAVAVGYIIARLARR